MACRRLPGLLAVTWRYNVMVVVQTGLIVKTLSFGFTVRYGDTRDANRAARAVHLRGEN